MKKYTLNDLKRIIKITNVLGNSSNHYFSNARSIENANENSIVWIKPSKENKLDLLKTTKANFVICDINLSENDIKTLEKTILIVDNPKLEFIRVIKTLFVKKIDWMIHPSSIIHPEAELHKNVFIGPNTVIGKCKIDEGTIIHGNCFIYDDVKIGKQVIINANTVIGSEGFGYSRNEAGEFEHFPHIGGVIIENNVDIGSNTSIDRGALGNTIIKEGSKIDNLVHIAHNVVIGKHSAIIANAMLGGSTIIGEYAWVAPSASLMNQISIGNKATIGMGAVVTKNIPDNEVWTGIPARPLQEFIEQQKKIKKL